MSPSRLAVLTGALAVSMLAIAPGAAQEAAPDASQGSVQGPRVINWDDLLPQGEMEEIARRYALSQANTNVDHFGAASTQIGTFNVVEELIGETVRLPGFILPLDAQIAGNITEFLLVPYVGACVHMPPPPPNQIVYVLSDTPVRMERLWEPIWVTGLLTADQTHSSLGSTAYTLELDGTEPYEY